MSDRASDDLVGPGDAPDDDLGDEGGPTQAGEERWEERPEDEEGA